MDAFIVMLKNVLLFVALAIPGYLLVKTKILKAADTSVLSNIMLYLATPFLVVYSVMDMTFSQNEWILTGWTVVAALAYIAMTFFLSAPFTVREKGDIKKRGMSRFCASFANNGFLGIPLAVAVFGAGSPVVFSLIIFNVLNNTAIFTLGAYLVSGNKKAMSLKKVLLNPVLIGLLAGVLLNVCNISEWLPESKTFAGHFNNIVTPLAMTVLGMKLACVNIQSILTSWNGYVVSALKLVIFPVIGIGVLLGLHSLFPSQVSQALVLAAFIAFATPTASLCSALADKYDGDSDGAAVYTLLSTLLSVITLPILYGLLCVMI